MSRPFKKGLSSFPFYVKDERFQSILAYHGAEGFMILSCIISDLHTIEGYYLHWHDRAINRFILNHNLRSKKAVLERVLKDCFEDKFFDEEMFKKHAILTSIECQKVWMNGVKERLGVEFKPEYMLIEMNTFLEKLAKNKKRAETKEKNRISS